MSKLLAKYWIILGIILIAGITLRISWYHHIKTTRELYSTSSNSFWSALVAYDFVHGKFGTADIGLYGPLAAKMKKMRRLPDLSPPPSYKPGPHRDVFKDEIGLGILQGIIWKITGRYKFSYIRILQVLLDGLGIILLFIATRRVFGGVIPGIICAG
ncbi:MAG: hypothetical protein J7M18_08440, partial [Candidatus Eremiobacteraeota bacterium]|nr:hypothetical protein [Candidatus Eremiobacteraeota bacterium]